MTLIISWIDKRGAHQCGDSRFFMTDGTHSDNTSKLITLFDGRILIGVAGSWGVGGVEMPRYLKNFIPSYSVNEKKDEEYFIKNFAKNFAAHLTNEMTQDEIERVGSRLTIITEDDSEFIISAIDAIKPNRDPLAFTNWEGQQAPEQLFSGNHPPVLEYRLKYSQLYKGNQSPVFARGHSTLESAFNSELKINAGWSYPDILRSMITEGIYGEMMGGLVFCQHKLSDVEIANKVEEICQLGEIKSERDSILSIVKEITDRSFDFNITNVAPKHFGCETSINWSEMKMKLNINVESKGFNLIWDMLHELGHVIDGRPLPGEEKSLTRETSAWLHAYEKAKELRLGHYRNSFIERLNDCMSTYYKLRDMNATGKVGNQGLGREENH
jgi:hypothetical protein